MFPQERGNEFEEKEDNLNATDNRESSQESHGAANETHSCGEINFCVPFYLVKGGRVKVDLDQFQCGRWVFLSWSKGEDFVVIIFSDKILVKGLTNCFLSLLTKHGWRLWRAESDIAQLLFLVCIVLLHQFWDQLVHLSWAVLVFPCLLNITADVTLLDTTPDVALSQCCFFDVDVSVYPFTVDRAVEVFVGSFLDAGSTLGCARVSVLGKKKTIKSFICTAGALLVVTV